MSLALMIRSIPGNYLGQFLDEDSQQWMEQEETSAGGKSDWDYDGFCFLFSSPLFLLYFILPLALEFSFLASPLSLAIDYKLVPVCDRWQGVHDYYI